MTEPTEPKEIDCTNMTSGEAIRKLKREVKKLLSEVKEFKEQRDEVRIDYVNQMANYRPKRARELAIEYFGQAWVDEHFPEVKK